MKKFTLISALLLFISVSAFSQTTLRVFSDLESEKSMFKLYVRGQSQDAMYTDDIEVENLRPGNYTLRLVFNSDTIADFITKIKILKNTPVIAYEVIDEAEYKKRARKAGRKVGRFFKKTGKDDKKGLVEWYKIEEVPVEEEIESE